DAYFTFLQGGYIMDDHYPINTIRKIPTIDIIQLDRNSETGFASYWHTTKDDMGNIDKNTLYTVGTTLLNVIFNE
ncbi:MAG: M28 family peptidase, partial [Bacteroidales bacterium]|nr:M28 family peptidase [Bacteroidales bacterium]